MGRHTLFRSDIPPVGDRCAIEGDEAKHAVRVKRLRTGDEALLTDGCGRVARAAVEEAGRALTLTIRSIDTVPPIRPSVRVFAASPKGARLERMVDALSQVGASSWSPLATERGVVEPGENKMARAARVALESAKQSGRPWIMSIDGSATIEEALSAEHDVVLADETGDPYEPRGAERIALLVGPEGGWTERELETAREAGARVRRFGVRTMRVEVAAPVAAACIIDHEQRD
mgnify:CR=1 FL=1